MHVFLFDRNFLCWLFGGHCLREVFQTLHDYNLARVNVSGKLNGTISFQSSSAQLLEHVSGSMPGLSGS